MANLSFAEDVSLSCDSDCSILSAVLLMVCLYLSMC